MSFEFIPLEIPEILLIKHPRFNDNRGFFCETFRQDVFEQHGISNLVQDNHSRSTHGVLRGLHYQLNPAAQGKLVRCTQGRIFDVAVDIRIGSPTFAHWISMELSETDNYMLWIPIGFAHGFCALSEMADVVYRISDYYSPQHSRGILWNDPQIGITWPISNPELSEKDKKAPLLEDAEIDFSYT